MIGYNVLAILNSDKNKILMCKREKEPYKGLINLNGGKIEENENGIEAAYRELYEETNISKKDIELKHLMDFKYYIDSCYVEVYVGRLKNEKVNIKGEENKLIWMDIDNDFFDINIFAGEGNIGHIMEHIRLFEKELFD